ncbi:hypothetical protein GCM10027447_07270 [Glycomyces halotolerans]
MTVFWDLPGAGFEAGAEFWLDITRSILSPRRGPDGEFATLVPPDGDPYMRVQRIGSGDGGVHLDLHTEDVEAETDRALSLGATILNRDEGLSVMRSPGGFVFCVVDYHGETARPVPARSPAGQLSIVDQLCIDIPPRHYESEIEFWPALTGHEQVATGRPEFQRLLRPPGRPIGFLLQRLDSAGPDEPTRAHIDLACSDVEAETRRHVRLGATALERFEGWQVLRDPAGLTYCITARDPQTGLPSGGQSF